MTVRSRHRPALAWLLAGALAVGCSDDEPKDCPTEGVPCDIREASCRDAVFALTACMRGQRGAEPPPSRIITREQYAMETRSEVAQSQSTTSRVRDVYEGALKLLKLLPSDTSLGDATADSNIEGVAAYYDTRNKQITVIADVISEMKRDALERGTFTLSHEYTHALQDQREGLASLSKNESTTDGSMAVDSLVEGEAVIMSDLVIFRAVAGQSADGADAAWQRFTKAWLPHYDQTLASTLTLIAKSSAPYNEAQLLLPYPIGSRPLASAYLEAGLDGVRGFYEARPKTLISWIEPEAQIPRALPCSPPEPPTGYQLLGSDRTGGTGLIALYTRLGLSGPGAYEAARAWTNDLISIYAPPTETSAAVAWRIQLRDEASAMHLETQVTSANLGLSVSRTGDAVLLTAAAIPEVLAGWSTRNDCRTNKGRGGEPSTTRLFSGVLHRPHRPPHLSSARWLPAH